MKDTDNLGPDRRRYLEAQVEMTSSTFALQVWPEPGSPACLQFPEIYDAAYEAWYLEHHQDT